MANTNTPEYLDKIKTKLFENLRMLPHAPGVQMQAVAEDAIKDIEEDVEEDTRDPDKRISIRASDKMLLNESEFYDEDEQVLARLTDNSSQDHQSHKRPLETADDENSANKRTRDETVENGKSEPTETAEQPMEQSKTT